MAGWEPTSEARAYMTSVYYVGEAVASEPLRRTREELFVNYADDDGNGAARIVYVTRDFLSHSDLHVLPSPPSAAPNNTPIVLARDGTHQSKCQA